MNFQVRSDVKTCKKHKGNKYMSVCSFPQCYSQRLCCLKCMVSQHNDHSHYQILLDELQDSNIQELQVPTNWTNVLGDLKEDLGDIIRICKSNIAQVSNFDKNMGEEIKKIDFMFDTIIQEFTDKMNENRDYLKQVTMQKTQETSNKLNELISTLQRILSPQQLLDKINSFIRNEQEMAYDDQDVYDTNFEEELNEFFQKPRINMEEHDQIYKQFNFLTKNQNIESLVPKIQINMDQINEIREQLLNTIDDKQKFAQMFFTENKLNDFENLEQIRVFTSGYDEMTDIQGVINNIEPLDNENFLLQRNVQFFEIWNIQQHQLKKKVFIRDFQSNGIPVKTTCGLQILYYSQKNTINLYDVTKNNVIKQFPNQQNSPIKYITVISSKDNYCNIKEKLSIAVLFDNGIVKIIDMARGSIQELKNKNTSLFIETINELRYYVHPEKNIIQTNLLLSCSQEQLSVWYPETGKCARNIKIGNKTTEVLKQIKAFEITNYEKQHCHFTDTVVNCPTKMAVAVLSNRFLRIYNWFKSQCLKEIQIDDCDKFQILPTFVKSQFKNIFLLYNIHEKKAAEYVTCDWSSTQPQYWNSGSMTNYTMAVALNQYKVIELGKSSDAQKKGQITARLKSLT